jgi:hypothetical protein
MKKQLRQNESHNIAINRMLDMVNTLQFRSGNVGVTKDNWIVVMKTGELMLPPGSYPKTETVEVCEVIGKIVDKTVCPLTAEEIRSFARDNLFVCKTPFVQDVLNDLRSQLHGLLESYDTLVSLGFEYRADILPIIISANATNRCVEKLLNQHNKKYGF